MEPEQDKPRARPGIAVAITVLIGGLAIQDQLSSGSVDSGLLGALVLLALFWAGQSIDRWVGK